MKVKRYLTKDMAEAMIKIKNELGNDAVILHSRKIRKPGFWGYFSRPLMEVVAAIDEDKERDKEDALTKAIEISNKLKENTRPQVQEVKQPEASSEIEKINLDIQYLKEMIQTLINEKRDSASTSRINLTEATVAEVAKTINSADLLQVHEESNQMVKKPAKTRHQRMVEILKENDVNEAYLKHFEDRFANLKLGTKADVRKAMKAVFDDMLGQVFTIEKDYKAKKIFFFVGPTGVGKTTTLAKLAARLSLLENKRIGLVTADTYRIAAVEQLRTYSEILGVPLTVIYEADELSAAIKKYKDMDFILVDTAGRSHKSDDMPKDIKALISAAGDVEIFLVISATTGYKDIKSIVDSYGFLKDYKVIVTKLDETANPGNVINIKMMTQKPMTYFTIGQSVPDDIEVANSERIISGITGE